MTSNSTYNVRTLDNVPDWLADVVNMVKKSPVPPRVSLIFANDAGALMKKFRAGESLENLKIESQVLLAKIQRVEDNLQSRDESLRAWGLYNTIIKTEGPCSTTAYKAMKALTILSVNHNDVQLRKAVSLMEDVETYLSRLKSA